MLETLINFKFTHVAWVILGVILLGLEFVIPGAVIMFFGLGAVLTGLAVALGLIKGLLGQLLFWAISSLVLFLLLRNQVKKWFPALERYELYDEDDDIRGKIVDVIKDIHPGEEKGRVRYQGSLWQAKSENAVLKAGQKAKITGRDNLLLYVEPPDEEAES